MGAFLPAALTIDVEEGSPETAARALWSTSPENMYSSRIVFHEAVHYWQQFSQSFLLRLAEEDWQRLIEYERSGQRYGPGSIRREFYREEPDLGFSARDIHECLARFWEVVAFGPNRIMNEQWVSGRSSFHPDFVTANRPSSFRQEFESLVAWGSTDFLQAMTMIGGEYATPYLATGHTMPRASMLVFPWLAHYALQTNRPATVFLRFIEDIASKLATAARRISSQYSMESSDTFYAIVRRMSEPVFLECFPVANKEGEAISSPLATYASCHTVSPPIQWTFEHRVVPALPLLAESQTVLASASNPANDSIRARYIRAVRLLEGAMATPGLTDSRTLLLLVGFAPPFVQFPNGAIVSIPEQYRHDARKSPEVLGAVDLLTDLLPFVLGSAGDQQDADILRLSGETRSRWQSFMRARRTAVPGASEDSIS